jgi:hypothetical protein
VDQTSRYVTSEHTQIDYFGVRPKCASTKIWPLPPSVNTGSGWKNLNAVLFKTSSNTDLNFRGSITRHTYKQIAMAMSDMGVICKQVWASLEILSKFRTYVGM